MYIYKQLPKPTLARIVPRTTDDTDLNKYTSNFFHFTKLETGHSFRLVSHMRFVLQEYMHVCLQWRWTLA